MVPTWTGKAGKWENISSQGKVRKFLTAGTVREFYPKYWKMRGLDFSHFLFSFFLIFYLNVANVKQTFYLLNSFYKTLKKIWKG